MAVPLPELKIELATDPEGYDYASPIAAGNWYAVANEVNKPRNSTPLYPQQLASCADMQRALYREEFYPLSASKRLLWNTYTRNELDLSRAPEMMAQIEALFAGVPGSVTVPALQTQVWNRKGSRGELLWGEGTVVTAQECEAAWALP